MDASHATRLNFEGQIQLMRANSPQLTQKKESQVEKKVEKKQTQNNRRKQRKD